MDDTTKVKRVQPSKRCPKCGAHVDPASLAANNGVCLCCIPAAGFVTGVYEPKGVRK